MKAAPSSIPPDGVDDQTLTLLEAKDTKRKERKEKKVSSRFEGWNSPSYPAELDQWVTITSGATIFGFVCGAILGVASGKKEALSYLAAHGTQLPLKEQQRILYKGMAQASSRKAVFWAINFGVFVGLYSGVQKYLQVRRERNDFWNSMVGGTAAGALFSLRHGLSVVPRGTIIGAGLGLAAGLTTDLLNPLFPKEFVNPPRIPISSAPEMTEADVLAVGDSLADSLTEYEEFQRWADAIERRALLDKPTTIPTNEKSVASNTLGEGSDFVDRKARKQ